MYYHALKLSRLSMLKLALVSVSSSAIAADSAPTSQIGPTA
ncbi:DsbA family protein, partial [Salmonella enterica subsp. enterica serovar Infantis]